MSILEEAKIAKSTYQTEILSRPNVVGLGVGYKVSGKRVTDELSVVVMVREKLPLISLRASDWIPQEVAGVRTDVVEVGELRPLESHTARIRPAPGGVSIGHHLITAGTLGCVVRDRKSGARLILSNNHVLANRNEASQGDPILQPGPADGGTPERDTIALLERFEPILYNQEPAACSVASSYAYLGNKLASFFGSQHRLEVHQFRPYAANLIDAALARPILESEVSDEIMGIGEIAGVSLASLGMDVMKSGRTTAFTNGTINILDATVTVNYGGDRTATFNHQIVSSPMSQGGDSGSLLVEKASKQALGLLFAGSSQATLFNPIQSVLSLLKVDLITSGPKSINGRRSEIEKVQAVKESYQDLLMSKPNVVGVGIGLRQAGGKRTDQLGLVVMVQRKLPAAQLKPDEILPAQIDGVPVDVQEVGQFSPF